MKAKERLAVSPKGAPRRAPPWSLVKELVQTSWDEAPEATVCTITVEPLKASIPQGGAEI